MGHKYTALDVLRGSGAEAEMIDTSCRGMAGTFGNWMETKRISRDVAELALALAVRAAPKELILLADKLSCRNQILDSAMKRVVSTAIVLDRVRS
ncbi:MAG: hypothetical protein AAGC81_07935 [Pseudomonadota bacterium]